jgi:hypothetical protein
MSSFAYVPRVPVFIYGWREHRLVVGLAGRFAAEPVFLTSHAPSSLEDVMGAVGELNRRKGRHRHGPVPGERTGGRAYIYNAKQEHSDTTNLQERDLIHENENNHVNAYIRGLTVTKQHHSHNLTCWKKSYAHQRVGYGHQIDLNQ